MTAEREGTDIVPGYRPVSVLAVVAGLAGLVSAVALVSPALWMVPLISLVLSLWALHDVAAGANDASGFDAADDGVDGGGPGARESGRPAAAITDRKTGRWWALAGLALSLGFGAQAVATTLTQRVVAFSRSESAARMFLDMVRADRMGDAVKVCLAQVYPPPKMGGFGAQPTPDVQALQAEASLAGMEVIRAIQACGTAAPIDIRCEGAEPRLPNSWAVRVRIGPCEGGGKPLRLTMLMQSKPVTRGQRQFDNWMVAGIAGDPAE